MTVSANCRSQYNAQCRVGGNRRLIYCYLFVYSIPYTADVVQRRRYRLTADSRYIALWCVTRCVGGNTETADRVGAVASSGECGNHLQLRPE